jgi:hypothetical protein
MILQTIYTLDQADKESAPGKTNSGMDIVSYGQHALRGGDIHGTVIIYIRADEGMVNWNHHRPVCVPKLSCNKIFSYLVVFLT